MRRVELAPPLLEVEVGARKIMGRMECRTLSFQSRMVSELCVMKD
jgi:hypothetical protein